MQPSYLEESPARNIAATKSPPEAGLRQKWRSAEEGCRLAALLVADAFRLPPQNVAAATRGSRASAHARQAAMYLAHVALGISLTAVGVIFGRDHSTVAHGCRQVEDRRDDPAFDALISELALAARIAAHLDREITA
jgi:chromosomal replication initiation ATPase DnaA